MKTKKIRIKQGFTIVELVIVIGVIGVLAAVLIPTFVNLNNKAQEAENQSFVKNLNTQMAIRETEEGKNNTMFEAVEDAKQIGFDVEKLTPVNGRDLVWDSVANRFALLNEDGSAFYSDGGLKGSGSQIWKIYDAMPTAQTYSIYAKEKWNGPLEVGGVKVGFDAGNSAITKITYDGTGAATIRTNGANLVVNAPSAHVEHYGVASKIDVVAVSGSTYVENGSVAVLSIGAAAQKVVFETGSFVNEVQNEGADTVIENKGYIVTVTGSQASKIEANTGAIKVYNFDQLQSLALASSNAEYDFSDKVIQLQNDISMKDKIWTPFGLSVNRAFSGEIDGNGKTITGLSYSPYIAEKLATFKSESDEGTPFGLIAYGEKNLNIHDLTIDADIDLTDGEAVAPFVGLYNNLTLDGDTAEYTLELKNLVSKGKVTAKHKVGGFIGSGFITAKSKFADEKIGPTNRRAKTKVIFDHCVNEANLTVTRTSSPKIGGFASCLPCFNGADGSSIGGGTLEIKNSCVNKGTVTVANKANAYYGAFSGYISGNVAYTINHAQFADQANVNAPVTSGVGGMYVTPGLVW